MLVVERVEEAIKDLKAGRCVLIYDSPYRESEVDMVFYAGFVDHHRIYELRTEAGGLICFGTSEGIAKALDLPLIANLLSQTAQLKILNKRPSYGDPSPFALWVNSIDVRTGISDVDRAKTISELHRVISLVDEGRIEEGRRTFYERFYAPGHVPILIARNPKSRKGHTELAVLLAELAELKPSVVFAEMLSYGPSMSLDEAKRYAEKRGLTLLSGQEILSAAGVC